jgi:hypothetical protein
MDPEMNQMVEAIAAQQMGVDPQMQQQQQQRPAPPTAEEQASEAGAPTTEAQQMAADPIMYEIAFGDQKRNLTPEQISSTFQRYSALNHRNALLAPVHSVIEKIMSDNPNMNPQQLAEAMQAAYQAQASNPQMGQQQQRPNHPLGAMQGQQNASNEDISAQLARWEEENAVSLPPGYKDTIINGGQSMQQMQQQLMQTQQMLQMVLAQTQGVADAARQGVGDAQNQQVNAIRQSIANNVDRAQAALRLPDEAANDFMTFATERGYTMEDFTDPQLTIKVMTDFRNNMNSPEMDRLRQIAQRRQAYTGSLGSAPSAGQPARPTDAAPPEFEQLVDSAMSSRMM